MNIGIDEFFKIDEVCEQFESQWKAGKEPPDLASFLLRVPDEQRRNLFECLLPIDAEFRRTRELSLPADSYIQAFPYYEDLIAAALKPHETVSLALDTSLTSDFSPGTDEPRANSTEDAGAQASSSEGRQLIGRYTVLQELGRGGQGAVYRAAHPTLPIEVAIKVGNRQLDERARQAMLDEAHVLCELDHPNIAKIRDLDFDKDGCPILVLELVRGRSLQQLLDEGSLTREDALTLLTEVAAAVAYAHRRGVLHLDLKPRNVVVTENGQAKVIDFGLARFRDAWRDSEHEEDGISGTPDYMAPEQARGIAKQIGAKSDVFALGAMLFRVLTEHAPFGADNSRGSLAKAANYEVDWQKLDDADTDPALVDVCRTAMARNQAERYESAEAFRADIQQHLTDHDETEAETKLKTNNQLEHLSTSNERSREVWWLSALFGIIAVGGLASFFFFGPGFEEAIDPNASPPLVEFTHYHYPPGAESGEHYSLLESPGVVEDDELDLNVEFYKPAYCFVIALNPDGGVQLCYPEEGTEYVQPEPVADLRFPTNVSEAFAFTDGPGQQVFLLAWSHEKLPSFNDWKSELGDVSSIVTETRGRWIWSEGDIELYPSISRSSDLRGKRESRFRRNSTAFVSACQKIEDAGYGVYAVTFPVTAQQ